MELNPNCIRDLMLFCESHTRITVKGDLDNFTASYHVLYPELMKDIEPLNNYDAGELIYHIIQLSESGYIATDFEFNPVDDSNRALVSRIYYVTPKGHEFIAKIKEKKSWDKTFKILGALGGVSLSMIEAVAQGVTSAVVRQYLPPMA